MTDNTKPMFELDNLNSLLKCISIDYEKNMVNKLSERGFNEYNSSYYFILNELSAINKPAICAVMAEVRGVTTQTIGKQVKLMERHGYASKTRSNKDVRSNDVELTKRGHALIQPLVEINKEIEDEYELGFHKTESIIESVKENLEDIAAKNHIKIITF